MICSMIPYGIPRAHIGIAAGVLGTRGSFGHLTHGGIGCGIEPGLVLPGAAVSRPPLRG